MLMAEAVAWDTSNKIRFEICLVQIIKSGTRATVRLKDATYSRIYAVMVHSQIQEINFNRNLKGSRSALQMLIGRSVFYSEM